MTDEGRHPRRRSLRKVSRKITGRVYVVHLDEPLGGEDQQAQHYTGSTKYPKTAEERLQEHKEGKGAAILRAANERGIDYHIVRDWPGNPHVENQLKLRSAKTYCPDCTPNARTPGLIHEMLKAEEKQKAREVRGAARAARKAERETARTERMREMSNSPPNPPNTKGQRFGMGARHGDVWTMAQINAGKSPQQIEDVYEKVSAPYYDGPRNGKQDAEHLGFMMQLGSDLELLRDLQRDDEQQASKREPEMEAG